MRLSIHRGPSPAIQLAAFLNLIGPDLIVLGLVAIVIGVPVAAALALNRGFQRRNPGKRPYRWGYYFSIQLFIAGIGLGVRLHSDMFVAVLCAAIYSALAWFFAIRHHWAWVALTILTFNPIAWIINFIYLRKRCREDALATQTI